MKTDEFITFVERTRDCDAALLDIAVKKGIARAKSDRIDLRMIFRLSAACAITAALCIAFNSGLFTAAASGYLNESSFITQSGSETLHGYFNDFFDTAKEYLGG